MRYNFFCNKSMEMKNTIIFLYLLEILIISVESGFPGIVKEYCNTETFTGNCSDNQVIIISKAQYGRMKLGRCVSKDYGYIGCGKNIIDIIDGICSGKQTCNIPVSNGALVEAVNNYCPRDFISYLAASYKCQEVYIPPRKCYSPGRIIVGRKASYFASNTAKTTSCGLQSTPLDIVGQLGQTISLELFDFAWKNVSDVDLACPLNYGQIFDKDSDDVINICGGGAERQKFLYLSKGHIVQIVLDPSTLEKGNFLIKYEAFGCPELDTPSYSWNKKENQTITIGCISSPDTWKVICVNNQWLGFVGTCPATTTETIESEKDDTVHNNNQNSEDRNLPYISNNHVVAFAMGCITVLICCSVIILGIYCAKRYEAKIGKYRHQFQFQQTVPQTPVIATLPRNTLVYHATSDIHQQATLPIYALPLVRSDKPPSIPTRPPSCRQKSLDVAGSSEDLLFMGDDTVKFSSQENPGQMTTTMNKLDQCF